MKKTPRSTRTGQIFVVSAPSGTGKSTLLKRLLAEFPALTFSVSYTTRAPRPGEVDGRDYHFVSREAFVELRDDGHFLEWAEVHGNFYGSPGPQTQALLDEGRDVLFDIDVQGAMQIRRNFTAGCHVFLLPPSREALEERLRRRGTDSEETMRRRIANARDELQLAPTFDYLVVNDELETAYADLRTIYLAEALRTARNPGLVDSIVKGWE